MRKKSIPVSLAIVGLLLAGCGVAEPTPSATGADSLTPSSSTHGSPSESPTSSATEASFEPAPSGESEEVAAVRAAFEQFEEIRYLYATHPGLDDWTELNKVSTGMGTSAAVKSIMDGRQAGIIPTGRARFYAINISDPTKNVDGKTLSVVTYCTDPTSLDLVYVDTGEPMENPRTDPYPRKAVMELMPDQTWRVADYQDGDHSC